MSKFKIGDMVVFKAHENNINLFDNYTSFDLYEPQKVLYISEDGSIGLSDNGKEEWHEEYFEHFDEWAKHQKRVDTPQERLYALAKAFIKEQRIVCEEDIYQSDRVIENAYQFLAEVFAIVGEQE